MSVVAKGEEGLAAHGAALRAKSDPDVDFACAPRGQKGKNPADADESSIEHDAGENEKNNVPKCSRAGERVLATSWKILAGRPGLEPG
jgi:hypothetical protein